MTISGILQDQTRILNDGRSGFKFCPKPGKFTSCKGAKNVYEFDRGLTQAFITSVLRAVLKKIKIFYSCYVVLTRK